MSSLSCLSVKALTGNALSVDCASDGLLELLCAALLP